MTQPKSDDLLVRGRSVCFQRGIGEGRRICLRRAGGVVGVFFHKRGKKDHGAYAAYYIGGGGGADDPIGRVHRVEYEHERDIQHALAQQRKDKRFYAVSGRLEERYDCIRAGGEGCADAENAQKAIAPFV